MLTSDLHGQVHMYLSSQVHIPTQIHASTTLWIQYAFMYTLCSMNILHTIYAYYTCIMLSLYMYTVICITHGIYYIVYMCTILYIMYYCI